MSQGRIREVASGSMSSWLTRAPAYLNSLPISIFYRYLWRNNKLLLGKSLVWNYIMPLILELLPWWASRRRLLIRIRNSRIKITHTMQINGPMDIKQIYRYLWLTLLHATIDTLMKYYKDKVAKEHKLAIRRLVMERVLFSEIQAFEDVKQRNQDLVYRITQDIGQTLAFFNFTAPAMIASAYALLLEGKELWRNRHRLDTLALFYPVAAFVCRKIFVAIMGLERKTSLKKQQKKEKRRKAMAEYVGNAIDGLNDIQINNLQQSQLARLDELIAHELKSGSGFRQLFKRVYNTTSSRGVFQYVIEVYVIHMIMKRKKIDFSQYRKVQEDIDNVIRAAMRIVDLIRASQNSFEYQSKVIELVNMPNWLNESARLPVRTIDEFRELRVHDIRYSYKPNDTLVPAAIDLYGQQLTFLPGKKYCIAGQNRAGKSTLTNILCKMLKPQDGLVTLNGIPYSEIPRATLRSLISYVSQRPFIFPGTVKDNIRIGNPAATDEEVIRAAVAAGVVSFASCVSPSSRPIRRPSGEIVVDVTPGTPSHRTVVTQLAPDTNDSAPTSNKLHRRVPSGAFLFDNENYENAEMQIKSILDQKVTARGTNMSGGFAQSVALARVFVRTSSKIVILDEAMGQMDGFKKREIILPRLFEFVKQHNMTLILISHDAMTFQAVDCIYVLDQGQLVHAGTHEQLIESKAEAYIELVGASNWS